jgi:hypothetical protein
LLRNFGITSVLTDYGRSFHSLYLAHTHYLAYTLFAAPEELAARGYTHSIGVHGDVLCIRDFSPAGIFAKTACLAGAHTIPMQRAACFRTPKRITRLAGVCADKLYLQVVNPGILFCNNNALEQRSFAGAALEAFRAVAEDELLYNEESVLCLLSLTENDPLVLLDGAYNFLEASSLCTQDPVFLHFADHVKPWSTNGTFQSPDDHARLQAAFPLWQVMAKNILGADLLAHLFASFREENKGAGAEPRRK